MVERDNQDDEDLVVTRCRLRVTAESDPSVLPQILAELLNQNITPRRVVAEFGIRGQLHVEIEVTGLRAERLSLVAKKMARGVYILDTHWHPM